jgi:hypothetical protein
MKLCPQCGHANDDDSDFCVIDGARLSAGDGAHRVVINWDQSDRSDEVPTQFVGVPQPSLQRQAGDNSKVLYGVIGALCTIVAAMGAYFVMTRSVIDVSNSNVVTRATLVPGTTPDPNNLGANSANAMRTSSDPMPNAANAAANAVQTAVNAAVNVANIAANRMSNSNTVRLDTSRRFVERTYEGVVGDNSVTMRLTRNGDYLTGQVVPHGRYAEITVQGYVSRDGTFALDEKSDIGVVTGVYRGRLNANGTMTGTWSKPDGDKTRSIYLTRR